MVSAALFPSLLLCLCCLWCQLRLQWKAARKVGDGVSDGRWGKDGRSSKGRRFSADELSGIGEIGGSDDDGSPRKRGPKTLPSWRETAARAKDLSRECKQQNSWQSIAARSKEQARSRAQSTSWRETAAKAKEHARSEARQAALEANRLSPLPSEYAPAAAAGSGDDPFARRKLPSIRSAALANAALQAMGDAPQPHRPSPMPPGRSASSGDLTSICKTAVQPNIVAPRAKRPPPAPPIGAGQPQVPSRWAALTLRADGPLLASPQVPRPASVSPQVPKAKRPPPPPPTSSPPPRRSLSPDFDEQRKPEDGSQSARAPEPDRRTERAHAMKPTSSWAAFETKPDLSRSASTPAIKRSTVHILVPSGGQAGLVRACLPQPRSSSDPARFRCGSRSPPCAPAPLLEALQTPDLPPSPGRSWRARSPPVTGRHPACLRGVQGVATRFPLASPGATGVRATLNLAAALSGRGSAASRKRPSRANAAPLLCGRRAQQATGRHRRHRRKARPRAGASRHDVPPPPRRGSGRTTPAGCAHHAHLPRQSVGRGARRRKAQLQARRPRVSPAAQHMRHVT